MLVADRYAEVLLLLYRSLLLLYLSLLILLMKHRASRNPATIPTCIPMIQSEIPGVQEGRDPWAPKSHRTPLFSTAGGTGDQGNPGGAAVPDSDGLLVHERSQIKEQVTGPDALLVPAIGQWPPAAAF